MRRRARSTSSTTLLSSTSRGIDRSHDGIRVREIREDSNGSVIRQLFHRIASGRYGNRARTNRSRAVDVRRRVADDHDRVAVDLEPELLARSALCDRRQLAAYLVIRPERGDDEAGGIDVDRSELGVRADFDVAREQPYAPVR